MGSYCYFEVCFLYVSVFHTSRLVRLDWGIEGRMGEESALGFVRLVELYWFLLRWIFCCFLLKFWWNSGVLLP